MINFTIESNIDIFQESLAGASSKFDALLVDIMEEAETMVFAQMTDEPAPIPFPPTQVNWDSPKQRAAFHATEGFGGGDPYERADKLAQSLDTSTSTQPGSIIGKVYAIEDWVKYLKGDETQSNIHKGRWNTVKQDEEAIRDDVVALFANRIEANKDKIL